MWAIKKIVMAGLDPATQLARVGAPNDSCTLADARLLDGRLKGGHDEGVEHWV
jgi:hypothetical protein